MTPHGGVLLEAWCQLLYDGLVAGGVATVVVSPGSRSTPLVLAASGRADLEVVTVVDERAAAFYALGRARAEGRPLALVRTSGSAAGHDLPAVIEARAAGVPLVVLTADRPHELMDARAPQTIDQLRLFGEQAVGFFDLGLPDPTPRALRAVRRVGMQAAELAKHPRPGAVQVNVRARKPLEAPATEGPGEAEFRTDVEQLREEGAPEVKSLDDLRAAFASARRPLLVAGPAPVALASELETQRSQLRALGVPVVIEATSQLRFGPGGLGAAGLEAVLRHEAWRRCLEPDLVVQLGEPPVSTGLQRALSEWSSARWAVAPRGYPDPDSRSHVVRAERGPALEALVAASREEGFLDAWRRAEAAAAAAVEEGSSPTPPGEELSEGIVTRWARDAVPAGGRLMVGNSLAVRHLDLYLPPGGSALDVLHQRGASGIDGLIAGAIGASQASPCVLLLGDVSARHDLGALALGTLAGELTVVVLHNGGGRIFEQLPLARQLGDGHPQLEPFLTEDARSLVPVAEALGWTATRVGTTSELREALAAGPSPRLIEAEVPPHGARDDMEGFVRSAA
ncbi:MAG: 2-succinyl-5-enolpyruvyl-6-hydroxy-3-cyclohexene-1-carboxylic-acid synthase, partial [Myxococcota bacterium]